MDYVSTEMLAVMCLMILTRALSLIHRHLVTDQRFHWDGADN